MHFPKFSYRFGIEAIVAVPGWFERLTERKYCVDREAQAQKHALVVTVRRSPVAQVGMWLSVVITKWLPSGVF